MCIYVCNVCIHIYIYMYRERPLGSTRGMVVCIDVSTPVSPDFGFHVFDEVHTSRHLGFCGVGTAAHANIFRLSRSWK